ncbi:MAG TPA: DNA polymerase IV, partial [Bacteroidota bacterium]|nr:DNA polymerase IV [Bacteroidota bacterium]
MRTYLHLDLDSFYASVETALRPELRGVPVCVGGQRGGRGIVTCPNYA